MKDIGADYRSDWSEAPPLAAYRNPYRVGWEEFLRHVAPTRRCAPISPPASATSQFAEACHRSVASGGWVGLDDLGRS